jgi:starch-binding outer membrane protein, SusD/RagB family
MRTKILYLILLGVGLSLASCSKEFLDEKNPNKADSTASGNAWQTEDDLNSAMASVYQVAGISVWGCYGSIGSLLDVLRTEEVDCSGDGGDYCTFRNDASSSNPGEVWTSDYQGIFYANQIIQYGGAMDIDDNIKNKYLAEAKFFRGFYYFHLVNEFGAVPMPLHLPFSEDDYYLAKSTEEEIWKQIESDFTEAAKYLPVTRTASEEIGRVTRGTALGFLGRAYLYQGEWEETKTTLKKIVDSAGVYGYGLVDNYEELFDGNHENSKESLFEIQHSNIGGSDWWGTGHSTLTCTTLLGIIYAPSSVGAWGVAIIPTKTLLDSFLREKTTSEDFDPRSVASLAWNYPGCTYYQREFSTNFDTTKIYFRKYCNWWNSKETEYSELNYFGMRYADVLLMLAEAYTMLGDVSEAAPYVQQVRSRANLADKTTEMELYNQDQMMVEIRHQRQLEFCMELMHFFDLRRWGILKETIQNSSLSYKGNFKDKHAYFPIPQKELDANKNLMQNDLWD